MAEIKLSRSGLERIHTLTTDATDAVKNPKLDKDTRDAIVYGAIGGIQAIMSELEDQGEVVAERKARREAKLNGHKARKPKTAEAD